MYPPALRPLLEERGAAWLNGLSCLTLGYPALLVTHGYEERALSERTEKEKS